MAPKSKPPHVDPSHIVPPTLEDIYIFGTDLKVHGADDKENVPLVQVPLSSQ